MRTLPLVLVLVAGCSTSSPARTAAGSPSPVPAPTQAPSPAAGSAAPSAAPVAAPEPAGCPTSYAQPDPLRPRLSARVTVADGVVTGTEQIAFTPDRPIREVVLRLWAAAPRAASAGSRIDVTSTRINGTTVTARRSSPTVLRLPAAVAAGETVRIEAGFRLTLPVGANDRFGHRGTTAWFGSGLPLLAWERGRGWAVEPATSAFAEASTSEEMELTSLAVSRARGLGVVAPGAVVSDDGATAVFRARAVRDVAVAVGAFRTATGTASGKTVLAGVAPGQVDSAAAAAAEIGRALSRHAARFGPFPYERLSVAVLPDIRGGIEYPGVILLGTGQLDNPTASHEVAHEWFYGLVGNDQARDPWLDESFATYAEALDHGTGSAYLRRTIPVAGRGHAGEPMTFWESRQAVYFRSVYVQGAQGLLRARAAAGARAFDRALGCHVRRNAHRITTPADLATSLRALPAAMRELTRVGVL
ncbi:MAG: hypothetical protein ABR614_00855 [Mycobacteriales bacterium]